MTTEVDELRQKIKKFGRNWKTTIQPSCVPKAVFMPRCWRLRVLWLRGGKYIFRSKIGELSILCRIPSQKSREGCLRWLGLVLRSWIRRHWSCPFLTSHIHKARCPRRKYDGRTNSSRYRIHSSSSNLLNQGPCKNHPLEVTVQTIWSNLTSPPSYQLSVGFSKLGLSSCS